MKTYALSHLADSTLIHDLTTVLTRARVATADVLAHLGEVEARLLYRPAGYPSMHAYCVGELHMSEDTALKRIRAARAARLFPAIYPAVAEGRLNLSAVVLLAPHLAEGTADELLAAAMHKTRAEIELMLARRFPQPAPPTRLEAIVPPPPSLPMGAAEVAPGPPVPRPKVKPVSEEWFMLQLALRRSTHEKMRYAQALFGDQVPTGDLDRLLERSFDLAIGELEKRKFAATSRPRRRRRRESVNPRHIPAEVKCAVWERDKGQCTFVSDSGHRCEARTRLEFDHIEPVARGGKATVGNIRLRCRAHNQFEADRAFGPEFMRTRREAAREARRAAGEVRAPAAAAQAEARAETAAATEVRARAEAETQAEVAAVAERTRELEVALESLGFRATERRRAVAFCAGIPDASIEERLRAALKYLRPPNPARNFRPTKVDMEAMVEGNRGSCPAGQAAPNAI
jgi:5-methylcytosine-specific restriction endonuclease McrA